MTVTTFINHLSDSAVDSTRTSNAADALGHADYYGISGTQKFAQLFANDTKAMSDKAAAQLLANIITNAPGAVAMENIADAISNVCRFLEEPCDTRIGLPFGTQERMGRIFDQLKRNKGTVPAYEKLMKAYRFRPSMVEHINTWISEAQSRSLENARLNK